VARPGSADEQNTRHRLLYVRERLPEVRSEVTKVKNERHEVLLEIKRAADDAVRLKWNRRKIYLVHRAEALKQEYEALQTERKAVEAKLRGG